MKKVIQYFKKDEQGMTLVELLAVVVILGIIGLIAFVAIGNVIENSKKDAHVANAMQFINATELHLATGGTLPEGSHTQFAIDSIDTISSDIVDPWDGEEGNYVGTTVNYFQSLLLNYDNPNITIESEHNKCKFGPGITKEVLAQQGRDLCNED